MVVFKENNADTVFNSSDEGSVVANNFCSSFDADDSVSTDDAGNDVKADAADSFFDKFVAFKDLPLSSLPEYIPSNARHRS